MMKAMVELIAQEANIPVNVAKSMLLKENGHSLSNLKVTNLKSLINLLKDFGYQGLSTTMNKAGLVLSLEKLVPLLLHEPLAQTGPVGTSSRNGAVSRSSYPPPPPPPNHHEQRQRASSIPAAPITSTSSASAPSSSCTLTPSKKRRKEVLNTSLKKSTFKELLKVPGLKEKEIIDAIEHASSGSGNSPQASLDPDDLMMLIVLRRQGEAPTAATGRDTSSSSSSSNNNNNSSSSSVGGVGGAFSNEEEQRRWDEQEALLLAQENAQMDQAILESEVERDRIQDRKRQRVAFLLGQQPQQQQQQQQQSSSSSSSSSSGRAVSTRNSNRK